MIPFIGASSKVFLSSPLRSLLLLILLLASTLVSAQSRLDFPRLSGLIAPSSQAIESVRDSQSEPPLTLLAIDDVLEAMLVNPTIYVGQTDTFTASMFGPSIAGWRVLDPSNTVIASSSSSGGWSVIPGVSHPAQITIGVPLSALSGVGYRAEVEQFIYGSPGSLYLVFDVVGGSNTPPSAPQNLVARGLDSKIKLTWTAVPAVTGYNVKRSANTGGPYTTVATGVTTPNHTDTGLVNGVIYYYVVTSVSAGGESTNSNEANATPEHLRVPLDLPTDPPLGILPDPLALPEWMDHLIPLATSSAPSGGSSSGTGISLPFGVIIQNNGADMVARNSLGSNVTFSRTYRSSLAVANISSPGLPRGWVHNWDYRIVSTDEEAWAPLKLLYPNGAYDTVIPVMSGGQPTGAFTLPSGVPYKFDGVPDLNNEGEWTSLSIKGKGPIYQTHPGQDHLKVRLQL